MTSDWRDLAGSLPVDEDWIFIDLEDGRAHDVLVEERDDGWDLSGRIADASTFGEAGLGVDDLWKRNRGLNLVGYVVDQQSDAWVTAWVPRAGATREEFAEVARRVAIEADRLEYYLTGEDIH